jgi:uncharacterized RDD family membrane protein YckC
MSDAGTPPPPPPENPQGSSPSWSSQPPPPPGQQPYGDPGGQPYGAPGGQAYGAAGGPPPDALAGFWIRFAGALIDGVLLGAIGSMLGGILGTGTGGGGLGFLLGAAYFTYMHASAAGQTIGQKILNIRVADVDNGGTLDYGRAFLRFLMSYVSGLALLIGYLWMLWDPQNQTWHDKVARSLVVKTQYYPPPGEFGKPAS